MDYGKAFDVPLHWQLIIVMLDLTSMAIQVDTMQHSVLQGHPTAI